MVEALQPCCCCLQKCTLGAHLQHQVNPSAMRVSASTHHCKWLMHVLHAMPFSSVSLRSPKLSALIDGGKGQVPKSTIVPTYALCLCCRNNFAILECYQAWLSMMKACRLRGPAGETYLAACGDNAQKALYLIVEEMDFRDKAVTAEAELLLREALLVKPMCSCSLSAVHCWRHRHQGCVGVCGLLCLVDCCLSWMWIDLHAVLHWLVKSFARSC